MKTFCILVIIFALSSCAYQEKEASGIDETGRCRIADPEPQPDYLTIIAAGDNLYHKELFISSKQNDTYVFDAIYEHIKPLVAPADIAFINQETLLAGEEFGFSSFPQFNTPQELGSCLAATGFNVVSHANNHVMDKGGKAVEATLDFWKTLPEVSVIGIHESKAGRESKKIIIEKNGIKTGFLAYTFSTNGLPVPKEMPYLVSVTDTKTMAKEIDELRPLCDLLVVSMHWGEEYQHDYNKSQERLSLFLAEHNVDIVLGHHPHVLQPFAYLPRADGKLMLCYYSLGNFVSAQKRPATLLGGMAYIKIKKSEAGIGIAEAGIIPVVTHYENFFTGFRIYPLYEYDETLMNKHMIKKWEEVDTDYFYSLADSIFGDEYMLYNPCEAQVHGTWE